MKSAVINSKSFTTTGYRIDPDIHLSDGVKVRRELNSLPYELSTIGENSQKVFSGNIFSRNFVSSPNHGVEYLAASDAVLADLHTRRYLSNEQSKTLDYLKVKRNWILVTCSGTLGEVVFTNSCYENKILTHDLIRIIPNDKRIKSGVLYAFLSSKYGYNQITQSQFGGVVKHINESQTKDIKVPIFPKSFQEEIDLLIKESSLLREEAQKLLEDAEKLLLEHASLDSLSPEDYDYYGHQPFSRKTSCFKRNIKEIGTTTINAFNHSERIRNIKSRIKCKTIPLRLSIQGGATFSSTGAPNNEVKPGKGIMLINQKDIFDTLIKGKWISSRGVKLDNLVEYGEVIVACDGTLGESESFCRVIFANEDLEGSFVSSHFLRMKATKEITSGYLFAWLNSEYGFRLIRNTQAGTKLCHPINKLFLEIPIPVIESEHINEIDVMVRNAFSKRHKANQNVLKAVQMIEKDIENLNK